MTIMKDEISGQKTRVLLLYHDRFLYRNASTQKVKSINFPKGKRNNSLCGDWFMSYEFWAKSDAYEW